MRRSTVLILVIMALVAALIVLMGVSLTPGAKAASSPSPSPSWSATPSPTPSPAPAELVRHALQTRKNALRAWRRWNRARRCFCLGNRPFGPATPQRGATAETWSKAAAGWKANRVDWLGRFRHLRERMKHPGGSSNGVRWIPLAKWVGWPAGTLHSLAGLIYNESSGRERADNGICRGLTQIHQCWGDLFRKVTGQPYFWGIFDPELHLRFALYIWRVVQHGSFLPAWRGDPAVS